jgi:hypothetical protein
MQNGRLKFLNSKRETRDSKLETRTSLRIVAARREKFFPL